MSCSTMRTEASKMPESIVLGIGNGLSESKDRFGLNVKPNKKGVRYE